MMEKTEVAPFKRDLRLGTTIDGALWVNVEWNGTRLSISGVEGPKSNGNCQGGCGQVIDTLTKPIKVAEGWTSTLIAELHEIWQAWHLNDMQAGSPRQMAHLEKVKGKFPGYPTDWYTWAKGQLANAHLDPDSEHDGYRYGSAWLTKEVPVEVLEQLKAMPDTGFKYPWARGY